MSAPRDLCPDCGKRVAVRKDGKLRMHNGLEYDGMWGLTCDGAGRLPAYGPDDDCQSCGIPAHECGHIRPEESR